MMMMAKLVSEWFMLVLSVVAMPADVKEFRVDVLQSGGRIETVIVKRTETGFALQAIHGEKSVDMATFQSVDGKPVAFVVKSARGPEQSFDMSADISGFNLDDLRKARKIELKARDNTPISLLRSGSVLYLTPANAPVTYVCH